MPRKGKEKLLDLTVSSSDESSSSPESSPARKKGSKRSSSSAPSTAYSKYGSSMDQLSTAQRMALASPSLGPRSTLFGGKGTPLEHAGKEKIHIRGFDEDEDDDNGKFKPGQSSPKRRKTAPLADGVLTFAPLAGSSSGRTPQEQLADLPFGTAQLFKTAAPKKRGRKKGKGKGKQKADSEEEEESSDEEPSDSEGAGAKSERIGFDTIVGDDPDRYVVRALIASPTMQLPWVPTRFATTKQNKPREAKITAMPKKNDAGSDIEEDEEKKKKKRSGPTSSKIWADKFPLFLVHSDELEECAQWEKWTKVWERKPVVELPKGKKGRFGAKFALLTRRDASNRHYLRFAIYTADNDAREWQWPESSIWVKDFPSLSTPASSGELNSTHTSFSSSLLTFLSSPALGLSSFAPAKYLKNDFRLFDFGSSRDVQLVTSLAGEWTGEEGIKEGGGFDSLARAMERLEPREGGKWSVEYLTPNGTLPSPTKFLPRLYAACRGVPPLEYLAEETPRAKAAKKAFEAAAEGDEKVVLVYPTASAVSNAKDGKGEAKYHLRWEGRDYEAASGSAKSMMRECLLKSDRVNHSNMILIVHSPFETEKVDGDNKQFEAFLYLGSHTPTPASWGTFQILGGETPPSMTLSSTELGVL
ncbi:hypothetical protein JCM8097_004323 [Rhodosporidiobolus ruineniae]